MLSLAAPAFADDWLVVKLRGGVQQQVDGAWVDVARGDSVPDDRILRTEADGHVDLQRGEAVVSLGASTQAQIHDEADTGFTTVQEDFGSVEIEADVRNVPHFSVETKFLAAVVKGTHFVVTSDDAGASVAVTRGAVAVESKATHRSTTVTVGQTASITPTTDLRLTGTGLLPAIYESNGTVFQPAVEAPVSTEGLRLAPAGTDPAAVTSTAGAGGTVGEPDTGIRQTAMLGQAGLSMIYNRSAQQQAAVKEAPVSSTTVLLGVLIGAMIGGVALLFRRYWH